jgi:hypothetical protein
MIQPTLQAATIPGREGRWIHKNHYKVEYIAIDDLDFGTANLYFIFTSKVFL